MISLRTLGVLDLRGADGTELGSILAQPKRLALLAYLAIASPGDFQRRDKLLALFWPESDEERARASLRQAVRYLRRSLGEGVVVGRGEEELGIAEGTLWCDAVEFAAALEQGDLPGALELYRGDLLESFFVSAAPEFERWLEEERTVLRTRAARAARSLADVSEAAGDGAAAVEWGRRSLALAPEDEGAVCRLIALLERTGDRAGAVRAYEEFARLLREEYELEPSSETQVLIARVREASPSPSSSPMESAAVSEPFPLSHLRERGLGGEGPKRGGPIPVARRLITAGAVIVLALVGLAYVVLPRPAATELASHRIVVAPFENRTGDSSLEVVGSMAADWIIQGLARAELGEVVPMTAALTSQRYVAGLPNLTDSSTRLRELARETGAGTVVSGSYYRQGDTLHFHARITDVAAGRVLHAIETVAAPVGAPLEGIDLLRTRVLAALAPLGHTRETHARAAVSPPTYEAYSAYIAGMEAFVRLDWPAALRHWERSAAADSAYPVPLIASAIAWMNLGNHATADSVAQSLVRSRDRLGPFESATLDMVQGWLRGDDAAAYAAVVRQARLAPGSIGHYQVAEQARRLNRPREALRVLAEIGPERGELRGWRAYWREATYAHHMLGDHRRELREARRARELYPDQSAVLLYEVRALAALGRLRDLDRGIEERLTSPSTDAPSPGTLMSIASRELHAHGYRAEAAALHRRAVDWYESRPGEEQRMTAHRRAYAQALHDAGRWQEAEVLYRQLAAEQPEDIHLQGSLGTLAARRGERGEAERISRWLQEEQQPYLWGANTLWRARIAALLGDREQAVALLREAFAQGRQYGPFYHSDPALETLREYPPFRELLRPKG